MTLLANRFNQNVHKIGTSAIRDFDQAVSSIEGVIKLTLGEPDFNTPDHVKEAGIQAIKNNRTTYAPTTGLPELLQAASQFMQNKYDLNYATDEVIVTIGATEALSTALQTILNPGDKVLVPNPMFSLYESMILVNGGEPVHINTASNDFILAPEMIEEALAEHGDCIKAIILNYPTNPTGVMWTAEDAQKIADVLKGKPIFVISDEIYSELVFEQPHISIATYLREQTFVINGVSKSHSMTGWRLGLLFAPREIMNEAVKVHQNIITCASTISQVAATEALVNGADDAIPMREEYIKRRDYIYDAMTALGFKIVKPNGAFYIFAEIPSDLEQDSFKLCLDLAKSNAVAFIPGNAFGIGGENFVRLSYAASMDKIEKAMDRLKQFVDNQRQIND